MTDGVQRLTAASRRYRAARAGARFFVRWTRLVTPGAVVLITLAFLSRLLWPPLLYALVGLAGWGLGVAAYLARRPSVWNVPPWQAVAAADLRSGSRGTFMALAQARAPDWTPALAHAEVTLPVRFPWPQALTCLLLALLAAAVLMMPDLRPRPPIGPAATTPLERTSGLVATLREEELAEEQYLQRVDEVLEQIRQEAAEGLGAEDWQALDGVREELEQRTVDAHQRLETAGQQMADVRAALAEAAGLSPAEQARRLAQMDPARAAELCRRCEAGKAMSQEELGRFLQKCESGGAELSERERELLRELARSQRLSPGQGRRLAEALSAMSAEELAAACRRMGLGELSAEQVEALLARCREGQGSFSGDQRRALLALLQAAGEECRQGLDACQDLMAQIGLSLPGRGGVNRGPGPAALAGTGDTRLEFGEFENKTFAGNVSEPEVPIGFAFAPPEGSGEPAQQGSGPGARVRFQAGDERLTWHSRLLPRHNDVMRRYFAETPPQERER